MISRKRGMTYPSFCAKQSGAGLIFFAILLVITSTSILLMTLDSKDMKHERDQRTIAALAEAKAALMAYSLKVDIDEACTASCRRPGELPCPDMNNNGEAGTACGSQSFRLGRFPWKTLGTPDLRDGDGERLWYALSTRYKNNPRLFPLNSDSIGTITVKTSQGLVVNDASLDTGVVAVIFSPGAPILREDGLQQSRISSNENSAAHYLDISLGEDNASFSDGTTDGFIMGPSYTSSGRQAINDKLMAVTREDMLQPMQALVLSKVSNALLAYFSGDGSLPHPANFADPGCLGHADIVTGSCMSATINIPGRLPVYGLTPEWPANSILRGSTSGNWFQQNGWREFIFYALAPACGGGTTFCDGSGMLQLINATEQPDNDKKVVLIASGQAINGQSRSSSIEKTSLANYLEGENLNTTNAIYLRVVGASPNINDSPISIQ
jgi:hypothetical protein